ncbi:hypothetical protein PVT67_14970 [Gallaecimonas kandeliae]|uniref:type IV pilus modification PilV family protein n=1 Tax=Gallaecimonas kandeliae TaxID=3029055 RepID=UPI00264710D4|nr:hypothetical protein [Gallaecimonas kandeliae]WKE64949.1 hypothetical protein PVT67_14970 [Gallaecimonas kandeliae]
MKAFSKRWLGFGLIEVMVAIAVIGIGVTGMMVLQKTLLRSSNESLYRNVAMELAKAKMESFRDFDDAIGGTSNYVDIVTGSDSVTVSGQAYSRNWNVNDLYYDDSTGSWSTTAPAGAPYSDQKLVAITVSWTSPDGTDTVTLNGSISSNSTADQKKGLDPIVSTDGPVVSYTPGQAPDVIALDLNTGGDGIKRESSKPVPDIIKQGNSTLVKFDTVTYKPDKTTLIREDFATINCQCSLDATTGQGYTPFLSKPDFNDSGEVNEYQVVVKDGSLLDKQTGSPSSNNAASYCTMCCNDHFDSSDTSYPLFDPDRATTPHEHFLFDNSSYNTFTDAGGLDTVNFTKAQSAGADYLEACRLLRVDGYYRVMQDWRLIDIILMRKDWLDESANQAAYRAYVLAKVKDAIMGTTAADKSALRDISSPSEALKIDNTGATQLMARGIYLDHLDVDDLARVQALINGGDSQWPALVPFYDVNLTLLADWQVGAGSTGLSVSSEAIKTLDPDPSSDYYGTYSRGLLTVSSGASGSVAVRARLGNTGVTGSLPTDKDDGNQYLEDSLAITVTGSGAAVTGNLNCLTKNGAACSSNTVESTTITVTKSDATVDSSISCVVTSPGGAGTPTYNCSGFPDGWSGTLSFSYSGSGGTTFVYYPVTGVSVTVSGITATTVPSDGCVLMQASTLSAPTSGCGYVAP